MSYEMSVRETRYEPAEYESSDAFTCMVCCGDFDCDDDESFEVKGKKVCEECVDVCELCGEYLVDKQAPGKFAVAPIVVRAREWANNGKLSKPQCPVCAADWIMASFFDNCSFQAEDHTREEIDGLMCLYAHSMLEVSHA